MGGSALKKTVIITSIVAVVSLLIAGIIGAVGGAGNGIISLGFRSGGSGRLSGMPVDEKKSLEMKQADRIDIRTVSTDIIVHACEGDSVKFRLHGTVSTSSPGNMPHLKVSRNGNTVQAIVEWKDRPVFSGWRDETRLEISVPSKYSGTLLAESVSGDITPGNPDYKQLTLKTISGDIDADAVRAASLEIETTSGDASIRELTTDRVKFCTVSGDFKADAVTGDVDAHSTSGDTDMSFTKVPGRVEVKTISGDVHLAMPSDAGFALDARSTSGDVTCDFPIAITSSHQGAGENSLAGTVGSGKGSISVKTVSGDIGIAR